MFISRKELNDLRARVRALEDNTAINVAGSTYVGRLNLASVVRALCNRLNFTIGYAPGTSGYVTLTARGE